MQRRTSFDTTAQQAKSSSFSAENIDRIKSGPTESRGFRRGPSITTAAILFDSEYLGVDIPSRSLFPPAESKRSASDKRADLRMPRVRNDPNACDLRRRGSVTRRPPGDILGGNRRQCKIVGVHATWRQHVQGVVLLISCQSEKM